MIYFIRHGEDDENYIGGWSDVELTKKGIAQIEKSAQQLQCFKIKKIISSDILRARQTAKILAEKLNLKVEYTDKLREMDKGKLTGMNKKIAKEKYPKYFTKLEITDRYPEGESLKDLYDRVKNLIDEINREDDVLIVTHRGVINMFYFIMNNIKLNYDKEQFKVTHGSIHLYDKTKHQIYRIGD